MRRDFLLLLVLLFFSFSLYAEITTIETPLPSVSHKLFDIGEANRWLDQLSMNLAIENMDAQGLSDSLSALTKLRDQANDCVNYSQKQMDSTDKLWDDAKIDNKPSNDSLTSLQKYLKNKKDELTIQKSECKLFYLRANEVIVVLSNSMETINKEALLKAKPTGIVSLNNSILLFKQLRQLDYASLFQKTNLRAFSMISLGVLLVLMVLSFFMAVAFARLVKKKYSKKMPRDFSGKLGVGVILSLVHYAFLILFSLVFSLFIFIYCLIHPDLAHLNLIGLGLLGYAASVFLAHLLFHSFQGENCLVDISNQVSEPLEIRIKLLLGLTLLGYLAYLVSINIGLPSVIVSFTRILIITLYAIGLISILWLINRLPRLFHHRQIIRTLISCALTASLLIIIVMEWGGYQKLVSYILQDTALTLVTCFLAVILHKIITHILDYCALGQAPWQRHFRKALGFHRPHLIPEFIWLKFALYLLIWICFIIALLKIWGMSEVSFQLALGKLTNGFKLGGLDIIPLRIFSALIFFIVASLLTRWAKHFLENRKAAVIDKGSQQALAAIISYIGISVVLLFALLIAGVNFAGLAIVAGALSVGIGFGLQNIVNNFVSGIILLIERPIKPGDRILVGTTEGIVKKISIRSTQIQTLLLSDLIVPNSEIVSGQVTNLMFHDYYGRIDIRIGVTYDSNTELVQKLLLDVTKNHPEVVSNDQQYKPWVLLSEFGESSLVFDIFCVIRDVNLKYLVASELRLAINKVLYENHITIAFPQRVIHFQDEKHRLGRADKRHELSKQYPPE